MCVTACYIQRVSKDDDRDPADDAEAPRKEPKKERVLHTRVPAVLEQELKRLAASWRVPVSNVVRAILEDALDVVEVAGRKAEGELRGAAERLASERERLRKRSTLDHVEASVQKASTPDASRPDDTDPLAGAVGFTPMVVANQTICPKTGRTLAPGTQAFLVLFAEPGKHAIVAPEAVPDGGTSD